MSIGLPLILHTVDPSISGVKDQFGGRLNCKKKQWVFFAFDYMALLTLSTNGGQVFVFIEVTWVAVENHRPAASRIQTLSCEEKFEVIRSHKSLSFLSYVFPPLTSEGPAGYGKQLNFTQFLTGIFLGHVDN